MGARTNTEDIFQEKMSACVILSLKANANHGTGYDAGLATTCSR